VTSLGGNATSSGAIAGLKAIWLRLGRIDLTSKLVMTTLLVWHTLTVFGFELGRAGDRPFLVLAIALMAEVLHWATYLTLYALQSWLWRDNQSVFVKVFILFVSNTTRTVTLEFALFQFGLLDDLRISDRFLGDTTATLLILLGIAYTQVVLVELGAQESALNRVRSQLIEEASASKISARESDKMLRKLAQEKLGSQLRDITKYLKSAKAPSAEKLICEIQELIDSKVRPLSAELWRRLERAEDPGKDSRALGKSRLPRRVFPASDFRPLVVMAISGINIFVTAPGLSNWPLALELLLWILTFPLLGLAITRIYPKLAGMSTWLGASVVGLLSVVAWVPSMAFLLLKSADYPELGVLAFTSTMVLILTSMVVAIWVAFKRERLAYLEQIESLNRERSRQLALIDQAVWVARRNWSYMVHGTVQGALTAAIARIQLGPTISPEVIGQILKDVERARAALNQSQSFFQSWREVWPQIQQTWDGVCAVTQSTSAEAEALLDSSSETSTCVAEIAKELVSNAFRHGNATKVHISISVGSPGDLLIESTNNGSAVEEGRISGIGSEMFVELTSSWNWSNTADGPRFTAVVPFA